MAIRLVNETLAELKLQQHPYKTFIGRISRGFDFLGYQFTPAGLEVAPRAVEHCVERVSRLYERGVDLIHIGAYVRCWQRWAKSGLGKTGEAGRVRDGLLVPVTRPRRATPPDPASSVSCVGRTANGRRRYRRCLSAPSRWM